MNKYYHNPRCSKSRLGIDFLNENNIEFEIIEYLKTGVSEKDFLEIVQKSGLKPLEGLVRTKESLFKDLGLKGKNLTDKEWAKVINENPKLLERPILVTKDQAKVGRPTENLLA
ncbi:MAG: arsenate reductase (glutaredoxin) [Halobacteriovorax sp.]|nr:arsenate reductase (glutaredoxin) [Halobacteriovorax sp.]MEE3079555.1 arsenate reductase (glutaredoxin) [Bdellovibrionota bacterium]|tara:strand:- start:297 stop:638 length:342 start_codon:yes stop_codon:yes gene_type:complete